MPWAVSDPGRGLICDLTTHRGLSCITNCYIPGSVKLILNKALREFASRYPDTNAPMQAFRVRVEKGVYRNFAEIRAVFRGVDKVGERYVFNIGGNK